MGETSVVNIDLDNIVPPKKPNRKRALNNADDQMEIETHNGIESKKNSTNTGATAAKRQKEREIRKVRIPPHRYTPLKENWLKIFQPITEHLQLQVRFNLKSRCVEIRTSDATQDIANLQKAADFVKAFVCGFDVADALALLRLDDLFLETFEVKDVKTLKHDHLSRAVGRLAGKGGTTKFTIENATKTRIVLADTKIHILGAFQNIQLARRAICNLIMGAPPSKVYGQLRNAGNYVNQGI